MDWLRSEILKNVDTQQAHDDKTWVGILDCWKHTIKEKKTKQNKTKQTWRLTEKAKHINYVGPVVILKKSHKDRNTKWQY